MEYENIERLLGLHEELHVIYVVDSFKAVLYHEADFTEIAFGIGKTVREALTELDNALEMVGV